MSVMAKAFDDIVKERTSLEERPITLATRLRRLRTDMSARNMDKLTLENTRLEMRVTGVKLTRRLDPVFSFSLQLLNASRKTWSMVESLRPKLLRSRNFRRLRKIRNRSGSFLEGVRRELAAKRKQDTERATTTGLEAKRVADVKRTETESAYMVSMAEHEKEVP